MNRNGVLFGLSRFVKTGLLLGLILFFNHSAIAGNGSKTPSIIAGVPFFYYQDLQVAADWYENKLGLKKVANKEWVVIFELIPGSQIGLVNASGGSLKPISEKGALLSIETEELEAWYERLKNVEGINMIHGIEVGAKGMIEEFRMTDPGGYIIEFFRWKLSPEQRILPD
jgi:hypothetical protein